jgi:hypothetical protein
MSPRSRVNITNFKKVFYSLFPLHFRHELLHDIIVIIMPTNDWKPCEYLKSKCLDLGARLGIHAALILLQYVKCNGMPIQIIPSHCLPCLSLEDVSWFTTWFVLSLFHLCLTFFTNYVKAFSSFSNMSLSI